jgi:hypothetical protein
MTLQRVGQQVQGAVLRESGRTLGESFMRVRAGVVVAVGPVVVSSPLAFGDAFERYGASWRSVALPPVGTGSFDIKGDFLPDGRIIAVTGADVLLERMARSGEFDVVATLDAAEVGATDPSFLRVSPDGARIAIGAGFLKPVVVFNAESVGAPGAPVVLTSGTLARYYDVGHYDAAWQDSTHLAITAGEFGSASFVSLLDTSSSAAAPVNPTIVAGIGGASSGVAFDREGRLYTANGFDLDPSSGSATGTIRAFDPASWVWSRGPSTSRALACSSARS